MQSKDTRYFILDTKGMNKEHGDVDFVSYDWSPSKYNRVREGDLFLYRRPTSASEIRGKFYFFGSGKINSIYKIEDDRLRGDISKPVYFMPVLLSDDLKDFKWAFKKRKDTWEHFFNQYGMNEINQEDFRKIVLKGVADKQDISIEEISTEVDMVQQQQRKDYFVDDQLSTQKQRRGQKVFSDQVKKNFGYRCAITGMRSKSFLVGSHIIPWAKRKDIRLDPQNGICLSVFLDKAFDQGYITISEKYKVIVSPQASHDRILYEQLLQYEGKKIIIPRVQPPKISYLKWHNKHIFKG
nr:HNH endonuclease [Thalassobacillus pellis]